MFIKLGSILPLKIKSLRDAVIYNDSIFPFLHTTYYHP